MNAAVPPPDQLTGAQMRKVIGSRKAYIETEGRGEMTRWSIVVEEVGGTLWACDNRNLLPASWLARATVTGETPGPGAWLLEAKATTLVDIDLPPIATLVRGITDSLPDIQELSPVRVGVSQALVRVGPVRGGGTALVVAFTRPDGEMVGIKDDYLQLHLGTSYLTDAVVAFDQVGGRMRPIVIRRGDTWSVLMPTSIPGRS